MKAYLGLGSNIGDRLSYINKAIDKIRSLRETKLTRSASMYETAAWGKEDQEDFINTVVEIETMLTPQELFKEVKAFEKELERSRTERWAEREIDIDILFYGDSIIKDDSINIPHAQIENRRFVLVPMNEIAPGFVHPGLNKSISELLNSTKDILEVKKYIK
jgi:2-amino-4-hydroxy-6-hydroxymethyldihydropteridine diphosphokinase